MEIVDYKAQLRKFYKPSASDVELVDLPSMNFVMLDGKGDTDSSPEYLAGVEALFTIAQALKAVIKRTMGIDYGIMPLEGLWWSSDPTPFTMDRKADCNWTMMINQPMMVTRKVFEKTIVDIKPKERQPAMALMRFEAFPEGRAAQKLHNGPLTESGPAIQAVQDRIRAIGAKPSGKYHEVYLSENRKATPDKWRTIIRQPYI
ncbi:MAG: hypothetical protein JWP91_4555 [Fibrobacteres bacterium]|nr:hypothetical protein [Fibrobacterota bacterium]